MSVVSREKAPHYLWGEDSGGPSDGWHLVATDGLSVIEERVPPGGREVRHRHGTAHQFFYVLAGEAEIEVEGSSHRLRPGDGLEVPPGAAHSLRNARRADLRFLVVSAPPSHGDRELA